MRASDLDKLTVRLAAERARIDDALERALPSLGTPPTDVWDPMRYTLLLPGKRLRGIVVLLACEMLRGKVDAGVPLACAVEMVHAASLILDDLPSMDGASLRRGKPALHTVVGEAGAILAAVGLLNHAFAVIQRDDALKEKQRRRAVLRLSAAVGADGLIAGQSADLSLTGEEIELDRLEFIHSRKTGALFIASVELGAIAAGARDRDGEALRRYAKNLGLAFQITDDLLDYSGSPETTGKDTGLDRDKTTFVDVCGIEGSRRLVDELIDTSVAALAPFGRRSNLLRSLAEFVRERDR